MTGIPASAVPVDFSKVGSPEAYFGAAKTDTGNGKPFATGLQTLVHPEVVQANMLYLAGKMEFQQ